MRMRRHYHNENTMDVVRRLLIRSHQQSMTEAKDGKNASTVTEPCKVCGSKATQHIKIPRHKRDPVTRCPECGKNTGPGANTVRGSTNYTGSPSSFYDESSSD